MDTAAGEVHADVMGLAIRRIAAGALAFALFLWLFCAVAQADQETAPRFLQSHEGVLGHWSRSKTPFAVAQTPDGFVWVGADEGLWRFDGTSFVSFEEGWARALAGYRVGALQADAAGGLWIGLKEGPGLYRYDGKSMSLLTAGGVFRSESVTAISARRGTLWVGTRRGLWRCSIADDTCLSIAPKGLGTVARLQWRGPILWVAARGGLFRIEADAAQRIGSHQDIVALATSEGGALWFSTGGGRLYQLGADVLADPGAMAIASPVDALAWPEGRWAGPITGMTLDAKGRLWLGWRGGVGIWDPRHLRLAFSLPVHGHVTALLTDSHGGMWATSTWGHLLHLGRATFAPIFFPGQPAPYRVVALATDGLAWIVWADARGVMAVKPGHMQMLLKASNGQPWCPLALHPRKAGGVWLATCDRGILLLDNGTISQVLPEQWWHIQSSVLWEDPHGVLWMGGRDGTLLSLAGGNVRAQPLNNGRCDVDPSWPKGQPSPGDCPAAITAVVGDHNNGIWVGLRNQGLVHVAPGGVTSYGQSEGLPDPNVNALRAEADGLLWIATRDKGLIARRGNEFVVTAVAPSMGPGIFDLTDDGQGRFWLRHEQGLSFVDKRALVARLGTRGGMTPESGRSVQVFAGAKASDLGSIVLVQPALVVMATTRGLYAADLNALPPPWLARAPVIDSLHIAGRPVPAHRAHLITLGLGQPALSALSFSLALPAFQQTDRIVIEGRVSGTKARPFRLRSGEMFDAFDIPPGTYRVEARARVAGSAPGPVVHSEAIVVRGAWQHPLFAGALLGLLALICGVAYGAFRWGRRAP